MLAVPTLAQVFGPSGGTPGGASGSVQYNNAGAFGAVTGLTLSGANLSTIDFGGTTDTTIARGGAGYINIESLPFGLGAGSSSLQVGGSTSSFANAVNVGGGVVGAADCTLLGAGTDCNNSGAGGATAIGKGASARGGESIAIGWGAAVSTGHSNTLAVGGAVTTTASNQAVFGRSDRPIKDWYAPQGVTTTSAALAWTFNGSGGSGSDKTGSPMAIYGGKGTGLGIGGAVVVGTSEVTTTGSTAQTLVDRDYMYAGYKALNAGAATAVVRIAVAQGIVPAGGVFHYCVRASDATESLIRCGDVAWDVTNKGGVENCNVGTVLDACSDSITPGICAISTLTVAVTCASNSADTVDISINAAAAITETVLNAGWRLFRDYGNGAITPQ